MDLTRKTKKGINLIYTFLILGGILILLNYIASSIFFRFDITQNKDYSVSETSKETVKKLDDVINIKGFFSKELPSNLITVKQNIKDIIDEYKNYSKGKIKVSYIDPKDNEDLKEEAMRLGIPELQFSNLEKDKYQISTGYLGLAVIYSDKKEVIPVVDNTKNLEYNLTSAIKKVMQEKGYTVAFLKTKENFNIEEEHDLAAKHLRTLYNVTTVDISGGNAIGENIDTLIITGASEKLTDSEKYQLDQFLMKGKSLLVLQENFDIGGSLQVKKNTSELDLFLAHYGIKINSDLVLDFNCEMASFSSGYNNFITSYPFWPKISKNGFNKDNVAVNQLEAAVFPWTSSVELIEDKMQDKEAVKLITTSEKSWSQANPTDLNPQQNFNFTTSPTPSNLAVFVSGKFTSYFKDKERPVSEDLDSQQEEFIEEAPFARIMLIGDSDFVKSGFANRFKDNMLLFQNAVDALTMDEDLIKIRSKGISDRPIKELSEPIKNSIKFFNIFGVTIIVLLAGLLRYFLRKKTKFADKI